MYSAYDRELTAVYQGIQHFKYALEGRRFTIFTDHKPLLYAFNQKNEKVPPRRVRQLYFISQFSNDIRQIKVKDNNTADWLSRINSVMSDTIDFDEMAKEEDN